MEKKLKELFLDLTEKLLIKVNNITVEKKDDMYLIDIETDEAGLMIGHGAETIKAIQLIGKILINKDQETPVSIFVDVDEYRKRQEESVKILAERKASLARSTGEAQSLLPMSPYFRRVVHIHLTQPEFSDVETESVGEGDHRKVIIRVKKVENE